MVSASASKPLSWQNRRGESRASLRRTVPALFASAFVYVGVRSDVESVAKKTVCVRYRTQRHSQKSANHTCEHNRTPPARIGGQTVNISRDKWIRGG
jgi:hypothetical protein